MGKVNQTDFRQAALDHLDALYGFAMALTRNPTEAEDLVQETYLRAARAFGRLVPDSNLKSWLFAIMRNIRLNQIRHEQSGPQFVEIDAEEESRWQWLDQNSLDPHSVLVQKVEQEQVRSAIERLPSADRRNSAMPRRYGYVKARTREGTIADAADSMASLLEEG
jgi:RNA polymerase sigma-70 factor (ECF subfamily)